MVLVNEPGPLRHRRDSADDAGRAPGTVVSRGRGVRVCTQRVASAARTCKSSALRSTRADAAIRGHCDCSPNAAIPRLTTAIAEVAAVVAAWNDDDSPGLSVEQMEWPTEPEHRCDPEPDEGVNAANPDLERGWTATAISRSNYLS